MKTDKEWNLLAGKTLQKIRLERKISRQELSQRLSCTSQAVSQFELNGIGNMSTLIKICQALKIRITEFFEAFEPTTEKILFKKVDVITPEILKANIKCPSCKNIVTAQVFIAPYVNE